MKTLISTTALAALIFVPAAYAGGDLSRANPQEIVMEMGTSGSSMYFRPNHLDLETGKAYKLVLKNTDKVKHELEAHELVEKIFTRKVEVIGDDGQMLAEIKGNISEIEVGPGGVVEWYFVPVQTGENLALVCALAGHKEAGMFGTATIR